MILSKYKSDYFGALASFLCLLHCIATPLIYVVNVKSLCCQVSSPFWWKSLDYIFLFISFLAIYWSMKNTNRTWVKYGFIISWLVLCFIVVNEKFLWIHLSEYSIYTPSLSLIVLHVYNAKFCKCNEDKCCV